MKYSGEIKLIKRYDFNFFMSTFFIIVLCYYKDNTNIVLMCFVSSQIGNNFPMAQNDV